MKIVRSLLLAVGTVLALTITPSVLAENAPCSVATKPCPATSGKPAPDKTTQKKKIAKTEKEAVEIEKEADEAENEAVEVEKSSKK